MEHCTTCPTCSQPLNFKLGPFAPDEKLAFVERVCGLLIESRFGSDRPYRLLSHITDEPEREKCTFYDLTREGPVPSYMIDFINDEMVDYLTQDLYAKRVGIFAHIPQRPTPQTSARGSPPLAA